MARTQFTVPSSSSTDLTFNGTSFPLPQVTSELSFDNQLQTFTYNAFGQEASNVWFSGSTTGTSVVESISFGYDANDNMTMASNS